MHLRIYKYVLRHGNINTIPVEVKCLLLPNKARHSFCGGTFPPYPLKGRPGGPQSWYGRHLEKYTLTPT